MRIPREDAIHQNDFPYHVQPFEGPDLRSQSFQRPSVTEFQS